MFADSLAVMFEGKVEFLFILSLILDEEILLDLNKDLKDCELTPLPREELSTSIGHKIQASRLTI